MKIKKILSILLFAALISSLFCGCSNGSTKSEYRDDPSENVKLVIAWPFAETKDAQKVQEAVNKKLEKLLPNICK